MHTEKDVVFPVELPPSKAVRCAATTELRYTQRDTFVRVEGAIENTDCTASRGEYKLVVRIRNDHGERKTLEFVESWQRQDDQAVKFGGDYPIGENVEVVSVQFRQLACMCTDAPSP